MIVFSEDVPRLPNTTLFTVPGLKAETAVIGFDLGGYCGILGLRLLVRQGPAVARAGGHGSWPGTGAGSGAAQSGLVYLGGRH